MLTVHATLEPDGHVTLPQSMRPQGPVPVLVTFLDAPAPADSSEQGSASATLALLQSPAFRALPKADPAEVEQRIAQLRADWGDDRGDN
ncbi:MAG: hypothetical protein JNN21_09005 [Candidatus Accumulibacter sp.]|nr:hypothetical protein [Accumulibacter sp.]